MYLTKLERTQRAIEYKLSKLPITQKSNIDINILSTLLDIVLTSVELERAFFGGCIQKAEEPTP